MAKRKKRRSSRRGKTTQQRKLGAAARACKGKKMRAFRACVRAKLKK